MDKPVFLVINQISLSDFNKDFFLKVILAIIGALVGMLVTYILTRRKEKLDAKQISYDLDIKDVIIKADRTIQDNISITYKGNQTENLSFVNCLIKNTGSKVVKDQYIRFEFDKTTDILESFYNPEPLPEYGVSYEKVDNNRNESRIKIKHLEKSHEVSLNFIVSGKKATPKLIPFNEQGDVGFYTNTLSQIKSEQDIFKDFIRINITNLLILPFIIAANRLDTSIGFLFWILFGIIVIIGNLSYVNKIPRVIIDLIYNKKQKAVESVYNMSISDSVKGCIVVQGIQNASLNDFVTKTDKDNLEMSV